jgi:hypothetical protein
LSSPSLEEEMQATAPSGSPLAPAADGVVGELLDEAYFTDIGGGS